MTNLLAPPEFAKASYRNLQRLVRRRDDLIRNLIEQRRIQRERRNSDGIELQRQHHKNEPP